MIRRWREALQFQVERFLMGGPQYRLLFLIAVVGLVSVSGGTALYFFDPAARDAPWHHAVWWAFLRLTDPGYLGDDEGALRRVLSTVVTISGYVLFMGALIAVMTQWLNQTIRHLEMGLTPLALRRHVVVLGWSGHTPELVAELTAAVGRLRRFLRHHRVRRLRIAILADEVDHAHDVALRQRLGRRYHRDTVILRSGSQLKQEDLHRVAAINAATVVVAPADSPFAGNRADDDARLMKTLLTLAREAAHPPLVVAAVRDARKLDLVRSAYPAEHAEILAIDTIMGRLIAQTLRHPGLARLVEQLFDQEHGCSLRIRHDPHLNGRGPRELVHAYRDGIVIGLVRRDGLHLRPLLNPSDDEKVHGSDQLIVLARDQALVHARSTAVAPASDANKPCPPSPLMGRRILILGWSHLVPAMLRELACHEHEAREIDLVSTVATEKRQRILDQHRIDLGPVQLRHHEADFAIPCELERLPVAAADAVIILGSDRLESAEDADARTLATHLAVCALTKRLDRRPRLLVELRDPGNAGFFANPETEMLSTGVIISHLLAQIALRRELGVVYDALFGSSGSEFTFRRAADLGLAGQAHHFPDFQDLAASFGTVALGVREHASGRLHLNPSRTHTFTLHDDDALVLLVDP